MRKSLMIMTPGACTIKNYGFVIYGKWTNFVVRLCLFYCQSLSLAWTNTLALTNALAYYGIRKLRIPNVFIVQAPGSLKLFIHLKKARVSVLRMFSA